MKITAIKYYGGAREKVCRLGLSHIFLELQEHLINTEIYVQDETHANSAAVVRKRIDAKLTEAEDWLIVKSGDVDWVKRFRYNDTIISRIGVEIQVSGRSDALAKDIVHLRKQLQEGVIDVGVIVTPSKEFHKRLTDRVANIVLATQTVEEEFIEAQNNPLVLIAIEHDGFTDEPLKKEVTNQGKGSKKKPASVDSLEELEGDDD